MHAEADGSDLLQDNLEVGPHRHVLTDDFDGDRDELWSSWGQGGGEFNRTGEVGVVTVSKDKKIP